MASKAPDNTFNVTNIINKGIYFYQDGKYSEAIECFNSILAFDAINIDALNNKGITLNRIGKYQEAIKCFDSVLKTEPHNFIALYNKGTSFNNLGKFAEAIEYYNAASLYNNRKKVPLNDDIAKANPADFDAMVKNNCNLKSNDGNMVQSRGELRISNILHKYKLGYDYDKQITLEGNEKNKRGQQKMWVRPDFYLYEFNIIIEYWGLLGTPDYDVKMDEKKRLYKESNQRFISISPSDLANLEEVLITKLKMMGVNI